MTGKPPRMMQGDHAMTDSTRHRAPAPQLCPSCGVPITKFQVLMPGHCGATACARTMAGRIAQRRERDRLEAASARAAEAQTHVAAERPAITALAGPAALPVAVVPHQPEPATPLPPPRRAAMIAHLSQVIPAAFAVTRSDRAAGPLPPRTVHVPTPVARAGCTGCRGQCCGVGAGRLAFLTRTHFEELFLRHGAATAEAVVADYVAAIPSETVRDSCVYHTTEGCALPRDRRADICNVYECDDLQALQETVAPAVVVALDAATAHVSLCTRAGDLVPVAASPRRRD